MRPILAGLKPGLVSDVRLACRALALNPGLAAVVVLSLGVGIGVNASVFSWVQAMVFRPLPGVTHASTIYMIEPQIESRLRPGASWLEYQDLKAGVGALSDLAAFRMVPFNVGEAARNQRATGLLVSGNYFSSLGLQAALGRLIRADETAAAGGAPVAVISWGFWQSYFGGAPDVLNRRLRVNDRDLTVVGVTPDEFQGTVMGLQFDLWVPATMAPVLLNGSRDLVDRGQRGYFVMGRLAPGATRDRAQQEAAAVMRGLAAAHPASNTGVAADVMQYWRASRGPQEMLLQALAVLQGIMLLLLLAVCGNTANLLLARASARQREIGVRLAVGAGPWRVVRLLLMENLVMALLAAVLGAVLAVWGSQALRAGQMLTTAFPVRFQTGVDAVTLAFAAGLAVCCALVFGAVPALHLARVDPLRALRAGAGGTATRGLLRNALMAGEVALALVVLLVAGLFYRSMQDTRDIDPGFDTEGVLLAAYDLGGRNLAAADARDFASRLLDRLRALPDVQAAAIASAVPLDIHGLPMRSFALEGRARTDGAPDRSVSNRVTPGYFQTMGIPIVAGADFAALADTAADRQVIVNEAFVRQFVGDGEALGRRLTSGDRVYVIAGIVRNSISDSFGEGAKPCVYFSYRDWPSMMGEIHLRTRPGGEAGLGPEVRRVVREIEASLPLYNVRTMTEHVDMSLFLRKIPARMFVVLGPLLLVLAAIGIYAVVAYSVSHRTTEIGVRLALGATAPGVVRQVVLESLMVIAVGAMAGWLAVFMPYIHIAAGAPVSPVVFFGVPLVLMGVAAAACWLPARRAAGVDPVAALRHQ
jgi:predicted permease